MKDDDESSVEVGHVPLAAAAGSTHRFLKKVQLASEIFPLKVKHYFQLFLQIPFHEIRHFSMFLMVQLVFGNECSNPCWEGGQSLINP